MALSARNKKKHMAKAISMLPQDGFRPLDYSLGGGGTYPPAQLRLIILVGWLVVTAVISVLLQTLVIVGFLPMLFLYYALNNPRGVLLADRGLASFKCSFWNGRPTKLEGMGPLTSLDQRAETRGSNTKLQIGTDAVWLSHRDLNRMIDEAPKPGSPPPPPVLPDTPAF